jgi:hypothetical protein
MSLTPVETAHDPFWHRRTMAEFQVKKAAVGEPSPHMTVVNYLSQECPLRERLWRVGCYLVPYSLLSAEAIWGALRPDSEAIGPWVQEHWDGIHTRTERRAIRTPAKFIRSLSSWAEYVLSGEPEYLLEKRAPYERWWQSINRVEFFGRYISIRAIEAIRRDAALHGDAHPEMELHDIRAMGGDSPVRALTMFYPAGSSEAILTNPKAADQLAQYLLEDIRRAGNSMDHYIFAAMLCEYREAYEDGHQYPGRTVDQELEYQQGRHHAYWEGRREAFRVDEVRREIFPELALGEAHGWEGVRPELSHLLRDHGIVWSDLDYVWTGGERESKGDLQARA